MAAEDSDSSLVIRDAPPLPPVKKPRAKVINVVDGHWGLSTIFDPEPPLEQGPVARPLERIKPLRKSMISKAAVVESAKSHETKEEARTESTKTDVEEVFWCLPFFQSSMMATILEDAVTELRILIECNSEMRVAKTLLDMELLLALKYGVKQQEVKDELDGVTPFNLGCMIYKLNKLESDRNKILEVLTTLYVELSTEKCFVTLLDAINAITEREEFIVWLTEDEANNKVVRKELIKQLRLQRNHQKSVTYETDGVIANLKSQLEDETLMTETKGRYVDNWQAARNEQHKLLIEERESVFTKSTEYFKNRSDHEMRVHAEVESLTNIIITETLKKVEEWMDKYDADMEKIDLRIQITRSEFQSEYEHRRELEKTYSRHDKEIRAWVTFKEEREKAQRYHKMMLKSAITVQAWWRGLLVRKQMGPFRPKKKKK